MLPGAALAFVLTDEVAPAPVGWLLLGIVSTCLIASANYTINEWLDAPFDRHHPVKRHRPSAAGRISGAPGLAAMGPAGRGPGSAWAR